MNMKVEFKFGVQVYSEVFAGILTRYGGIVIINVNIDWRAVKFVRDNL